MFAMPGSKSKPPARSQELPWSPTLTFTTPGDLAVVYATRVGQAIRTGNQVTATFAIATSTFTWTTANGSLVIAGLPVASRTLAGIQFEGAVAWSGITKATYTQIVMQLASNSTTIGLAGSGSGVAGLTVDTTWAPSGGTMVLNGTLTYFV